MQNFHVESMSNWQRFEVVSYLRYIDGLAQDCSNSSANALELLKSCAKPWNPSWPFYLKSREPADCGADIHKDAIDGDTTAGIRACVTYYRRPVGDRRWSRSWTVLTVKSVIAYTGPWCDIGRKVSNQIYPWLSEIWCQLQCLSNGVTT